MFDITGKRDNGPKKPEIAQTPEPAATTPAVASSPVPTVAPLQTQPTSKNEGAMIGHGTQIKGDLQGQEDLRIEGSFSGTIALKDNMLTIGAQGKVKANVYAKSVIVEGYMEGDLFASERISIVKGAQVRGNVVAPRVSLEDGANLKGSVEMDPAAVQAVFKGQDLAQNRNKPSGSNTTPLTAVASSRPSVSGKDTDSDSESSSESAAAS